VLPASKVETKKRDGIDLFMNKLLLQSDYPPDHFAPSLRTVME
jgi:hypothetical protein